MSYSLDKLYQLAGRNDSVITLTFYPNSESAQSFGGDVTVLFVYDQFVREKLEAKFIQGIDEDTTGFVKAKCLVCDATSDDGKEKLLKQGVNSADIMMVFGGFSANRNLFHKKEKREIQEIQLRVKTLPKGGDYDWIYGLHKRFIKSGIGLSPYDREGYLAMKKFYEEDLLSEEELSEMTVDGQLKPEIQVRYLDLKYLKEVVTEEEEKELFGLWKVFGDRNFQILKEEVNNAGTNFLKLIQDNAPLFRHLVEGTYKFHPTTLNMGKRAVYLDFRGYLHVFLRHVSEFKISTSYDGKSKFLWAPRDVMGVMENVIKSIDPEIQDYWDANPGARFSKYGAQSLYYEGDYYTFHIEGNGRLSTFHRSKEKITLE